VFRPPQIYCSLRSSIGRSSAWVYRRLIAQNGAFLGREAGHLPPGTYRLCSGPMFHLHVLAEMTLGTLRPKMAAEE
jgi:hypothetical protein